MPKSIAAATGLDALTHAVEGYITKDAWDLPDALHLKAISMISQNLRAAVSGDEKAVTNMGVAQYIAGMGFSNAGLGIVHSIAHALGAFYDMPHGVANALMLPYVMAYNAEETGDKYRDIAIAMGVTDAMSMEPAQYRKAAVDAVVQLSADLNVPQRLSLVGCRREDLDEIAQSAYIDGNTPGNPKEASVHDILQILIGAY